MVLGETTHVVDVGKCCVVIRRVPCFKCEQCGKVFYTGGVMATLDRLVQAMKDALTEIAVIILIDLQNVRKESLLLVRFYEYQALCGR